MPPSLLISGPLIQPPSGEHRTGTGDDHDRAYRRGRLRHPTNLSGARSPVVSWRGRTARPKTLGLPVASGR